MPLMIMQAKNPPPKAKGGAKGKAGKGKATGKGKNPPPKAKGGAKGKAGKGKATGKATGKDKGKGKGKGKGKAKGKNKMSTPPGGMVLVAIADGLFIYVPKKDAAEYRPPKTRFIGQRVPPLSEPPLVVG
jgi:hypothetical protein